MNITYCGNYQEMSLKAGSFVISEIQKNETMLLCAATGNSPAGLYQEMAGKSASQRRIFKNLKVIKLDEWGGVPENHPVTCEYYLRNRLLDPLEISAKNYISFASNPLESEEECKRIQSALDQQGPIDLCILGLGNNGHLGFNEPGPSLEPHCHVVKLSEASLQHTMVRSMEIKPPFGLTLGMKDILSARKILLLIAGENKEPVINRLLQRTISTELPASFLWLHQDVECIIDQSNFR
jgi:galactosamine-6-phosphate isomerase